MCIPTLMIKMSHKFLPTYVLHCGGWSHICVMWSSKISWNLAILILRYSLTKEMLSFVFFCFYNPSTAHNFWSGWSILMRFPANCSFDKGACSPLEKWKSDRLYQKLLQWNRPRKLVVAICKQIFLLVPIFNIRLATGCV